MRRGVAIAALVAVATLLASGSARADEPVLLGVEGALALPMLSPHPDQFESGGTLGLALHLPVTSWLAPIIRLRGTLLGDGPPPMHASMRDAGVGATLALSGGLRVRPRGWLVPDDPSRASSLWLEVAIGAAWSSEGMSPVFEVGAGYGIEIDDVRLGPFVRCAHSLRGGAFDDQGALLLTVGAEVVLFDRRAAVAEAAPDHDALPGDGDHDRDGVIDANDECPMQPEDHDGQQDEDGCPEPDEEREITPPPPPPPPPPVEAPEVVEERFVLDERVLFDHRRARVRHSARRLLRAVVARWREHPEWAMLRVEGHADRRGDRVVNQRISDLRAVRVGAALAELGVPAESLELVGLGATRMRDRRRTEEAYQRNRRVELVVIFRADEPRAP